MKSITSPIKTVISKMDDTITFENMGNFQVTIEAADGSFTKIYVKETEKAGDLFKKVHEIGKFVDSKNGPFIIRQVK